MEPFVSHSGIAAPLAIDNVDTDAIIPSRETQSVSREGYGEKLFANWRYRPGTRDKLPDFVLNQPPFNKATILVAGRNFGCGSSREAAVWSLVQFGIRCVVAPSFGSIFRNNCVRNGLLPAILPQEVVEALLADLEGDRRRALIEVDLEAQLVRLPGGGEASFPIDALDKEMLLHGLDEIDLTLKRREQIDRFAVNDRTLKPWLYPAQQKG